MTNPIMETMYVGLQQRRLPQQVAANIVELGLDANLPAAAAAELQALAEHAPFFGRRGISMPESYRRHPGLTRAYTVAQAAMATLTATGKLPAMPAADPQDPATLAVFVTAANKVLGLNGAAASNPATRRPRARTRTHSWGDYVITYRDGSRGRRGDSHAHANPRTKMTADQRRTCLPGVSVRTYRRAIAAVNHLEQRTQVLAMERDREAAVAFGKGRLAHTIDRGEFVTNPATAAFVAYYVARLGQRTVFTNGAQDRPMDTIADALLTLALSWPTGRPDVIARVLTRPSVLARLSNSQKGELLGLYYEQLAACSRALAGSFDENRDRTQMVARPGDDSSTWNAASRAFNQARTGWLNLLGDLGLTAMVTTMCPGKVPALVAGDVAYWHQSDGGGQHADVAIFAELPLPWQVLEGEVVCSAAMVRDVCAKHGVNADASGWTNAYRQTGLAQASSAPDLVHGVRVGSPALAYLLRKAGVFAGRTSITAAHTPGEPSEPA